MARMRWTVAQTATWRDLWCEDTLFLPHPDILRGHHNVTAFASADTLVESHLLMESASPLHVLVGEQLSSVTFVMDYVQLGFDGPCLTAYTGLKVSVEGKAFAWGEPGFRNALCDRIGAIVRQAEVADGDAICISLNDGGVISISLKPEDYVGPEAAVLTDIPGEPPVIVVY
jgi:hypothetical protein